MYIATYIPSQIIKHMYIKHWCSSVKVRWAWFIKIAYSPLTFSNKFKIGGTIQVQLVSPAVDYFFECLSYMHTVSLELMQVIHNACLYEPIEGIT